MSFKRIKDWATTITSFRTGDVIPVDGPSGTAKMGKDDLLKETAQNALAGNVVPAFDPTRTSDNQYKAGESVAYEGKTYTFKVDHYGAWASADVVESDVCSSISKSAGFAKNLIKNNNFVDSDGWTANYCTKTISSNECILSNPTNVNARLNYNKNLIATFVSGHVYLLAVKIENNVLTKLTNVALYIGDGFITSIPLHSADGSKYLYASKTITSLNEIGVYFNRGNTLTTGDSVTISDVIFIDLTDIYGAGNEPSAELAFGALGVSSSVSQYYLPKENYLAIKSKSVVVVGDSSSPANECDVICDGVNDQQKINALIDLGNVKKIVFYKGASFAISAPIVTKSGLVIEGNGASLVMDDVVTQNLTSYEGNKTYLKMDGSNTKFVPGMLLQVKEGDNWFCRYLTSINYTAGTFYFDDSKGNTPSSGYTTDAVVSNVSSAIVCDNVSDVSIRDLIIDLNYENNPQSKNTFDAQNGVHVYESSGVVVENCEIKNGGRHGVLFSSSYNCVLRHCNVHDWHEHAVDLAWHVDIVGNDYDIQNHIVENCELSNASNYGVQMHRGCGCHVVNNYIHGNGLGGVQSNRGHSNVISGNVIKGNSGNGILLISCANNIVSDNVIDTTSRYGISVEGNNGFSKNGLVISANLIKETGFPCISIEDFVNAVIVGNMLFGAVVCKADAAHNVFRSNTLDRSTASSHTSYYEDGASVGANVFVGNTLIGCNEPIKVNADTILEDNILL